MQQNIKHILISLFVLMLTACTSMQTLTFQRTSDHSLLSLLKVGDVVSITTHDDQQYRRKTITKLGEKQIYLGDKSVEYQNVKKIKRKQVSLLKTIGLTLLLYSYYGLSDLSEDGSDYPEPQ